MSEASTMCALYSWPCRLICSSPARLAQPCFHRPLKITGQLISDADKLKMSNGFKTQLSCNGCAEVCNFYTARLADTLRRKRRNGDEIPLLATLVSGSAKRTMHQSVPGSYPIVLLDFNNILLSFLVSINKPSKLVGSRLLLLSLRKFILFRSYRDYYY